MKSFFVRMAFFASVGMFLAFSPCYAVQQDIAEVEGLRYQLKEDAMVPEEVRLLDKLIIDQVADELEQLIAVQGTENSAEKQICRETDEMLLLYFQEEHEKCKEK